MSENIKLLEAILEKLELRQILKSDGADLVLTDFKNDTAEISLIIEPDACRECILGSDMLIEMLKDSLSEEFPHLKHIKLNDPRENV